jgi:hypothetical protein
MAIFSLYEQDDFKLTASFNSAAEGFFTKNTSFGAGRIDYFSGDNTGDAKGGEFKPDLRAYPRNCGG